MLVAIMVLVVPAITTHVRVKDLLSDNSREKREERIRRDALNDKKLDDLTRDLTGLGKALRQNHAECREDVAELRRKINGKIQDGKIAR